MDRDKAWIAPTVFVVGSVLAGGNAVGVRFSNRELEPFWGATLRFALAATLMLAVMAVMRQPLPRGRALLGAALYGLFAFGGAFALAFYALVELEAGFGQILLSIVPLLTLLLAVLQRQEQLNAAGLIGAVVALAGVVVMSGLSVEGSVPVLSIVAAIGAAACFAQAAIIVRRFPRVHPVTLNAVGMTVGAVFLAILTVVSGTEVVVPEETATWLAVAYMVVIGSGVVFTLYVILLDYWEASRANYTFVLIPLFTVVFSVWLLDEQINVAFVAGGALVLAGVYIGALREAGRRQSDPSFVSNPPEDRAD
jgi:drug/metabolite transporter (DMT)-like permease